jgi:dipeptidase E
MQLHLFSSPGPAGIEHIVQACTPLLANQPQPVVAYLPAAAVGHRWVAFTEDAFTNLASVLTLDTDMTPTELNHGLNQATVLYIPGGNTYLLQHRLQSSHLLPVVQQKVRAGLPLLAFSAGTVLCGPTILTTNDMNICASTTFGGLGLTAYNFNVHFPSVDGCERSVREDRVWEYHQFHTNPVLALEDDAYITVHDTTIALMRGTCWQFEPGQERRRVSVGTID